MKFLWLSSPLSDTSEAEQKSTFRKVVAYEKKPKTVNNVPNY
jgi:hypothetical protein